MERNYTPNSSERNQWTRRDYIQLTSTDSDDFLSQIRGGGYSGFPSVPQADTPSFGNRESTHTHTDFPFQSEPTIPSSGFIYTQHPDTYSTLLPPYAITPAGQHHIACELKRAVQFYAENDVGAQEQSANGLRSICHKLVTEKCIIGGKGEPTLETYNDIMNEVCKRTAEVYIHVTGKYIISKYIHFALSVPVLTTSY